MSVERDAFWDSMPYVMDLGWYTVHDAFRIVMRCIMRWKWRVMHDAFGMECSARRDWRERITCSLEKCMVYKPKNRSKGNGFLPGNLT